MIDKVKIGHLIYNIYTDKLVKNKYWGRIYYDTLEIRIQSYSDGRKIKEIRLYETLLHEVIHGIDNIVKFIINDEEKCVDLIALYILQSIDILQNCKIDHFEDYLNEYEIEIKRKKVTFDMIVNMLNDNKELTKELKRVFK